MLSTLLAAAILATPAATPTDRLAAYILKRQPTARAYAARLARSIIVQSKRVGLDPAALAAVMWVESRFDRKAKGSAQEVGLAQLMRSDVRLAASWARLRPHAPPWRLLSREAATEALRDIKVSTYLAADELAGVQSWCRRAGHRIGRQHGPRLWVLGLDGVHRLQARKHRHRVDRLGHHQAGGNWPRRRYLRALRHAYRQIKRALNGK